MRQAYLTAATPKLVWIFRNPMLLCITPNAASVRLTALRFTADFCASDSQLDWYRVLRLFVRYIWVRMAAVQGSSLCEGPAWPRSVSD